MNQMSKQFRQANQAGVEVFASVADAAFSVMERIAALNLGAVRGLLRQHEASSRTLLEARDPQTVLSLQAQILIDDSKQAMDYSQRAIEISSQTRSGFSKAFGYQQPGQVPAP